MFIYDLTLENVAKFYLLVLVYKYSESASLPRMQGNFLIGQSYYIIPDKLLG